MGESAQFMSMGIGREWRQQEENCHLQWAVGKTKQSGLEGKYECSSSQAK